jgi:hypothetical protein
MDDFGILPLIKIPLSVGWKILIQALPIVIKSAIGTIALLLVVRGIFLHKIEWFIT